MSDTHTAPVGPGRWPFAVLPASCLALVAVSLLVGAGDTAPGRVVDFVLRRPDALADAQLRLVVTDLRLPRALAAVLVGAALGVGGVLLQAATRNPLAETGLLGVNSGAALGVVIGITATGAATTGAYLVWAGGGALVASAVVLLVAGSGRAGASPLRLILVGVALGATFRGLTSYLLLGSAAGYDQYRFWVLGSLSGVETGSVLAALPVVLAGLAVAAAVVRPLSALALGDDLARGLGHRPDLVRLVVGAAVALLAAAAVALAGPVAFLGLLAPYAARALTGPGLGGRLLLAAAAGTALLLTADVLARLAVRPYEAPASVLLALVGAPVLIRAAWSARAATAGQ